MGNTEVLKKKGVITYTPGLIPLPKFDVKYCSLLRLDDLLRPFERKQLVTRPYQHSISVADNTALSADENNTCRQPKHVRVQATTTPKRLNKTSLKFCDMLNYPH